MVNNCDHLARQVQWRVGGLRVCYNVLVAEGLTQECLLGADFFSHHGCIVNLQQQVLHAGGQSVSLCSDNLPQVCFVTLAETAVIPGRHQMCVPVHLSPQVLRQKLPLLECLGIFEPMEHFCERRGLLVARSLTSSTSTVACIYNPSLAPVKMHANEHIGQLKTLECEVPLFHQAATQVSEVISAHHSTALRHGAGNSRVRGFKTSQSAWEVCPHYFSFRGRPWKDECCTTLGQH